MERSGTLFPIDVGVVNPDLLYLEAFMNGLGLRVRAFSAAVMSRVSAVESQQSNRF